MQESSFRFSGVYGKNGESAFYYTNILFIFAFIIILRVGKMTFGKIIK